MNNPKVKEKIIEACIREFNEFGWKMTMNHLASVLGMSKKTIYTYFDSKEAMFEYILLECKNEVNTKHFEIYHDEHLDSLTKLKKILMIHPKYEVKIDTTKIYEFEQHMPRVYLDLLDSFQNNWVYPIKLIEECKSKGLIKNIETSLIIDILKNSYQGFYRGDALKKDNILYKDAIDKLAEIVLEGIVK